MAAVVVLYVPDLLPLSKWWVQMVGLSLIAVAVVVGSYPDINYVGLHRYCRDRLMEAFMPRDTAVVAMRSLHSPGADVPSTEALASSRLHAIAETPGSVVSAYAIPIFGSPSEWAMETQAERSQPIPILLLDSQVEREGVRGKTPTDTYPV